MNSQLLPNYKTQFSQKEEVGSYDNIALNQRHACRSHLKTVIGESLHLKIILSRVLQSVDTHRHTSYEEAKMTT